MTGTSHRKPRCRCACQISEPLDISKYKSRGFETIRGLTRHLIGHWNGAQIHVWTSSMACNFNSRRKGIMFIVSQITFCHDSEKRPSSALYSATICIHLSISETMQRNKRKISMIPWNIRNKFIRKSVMDWWCWAMIPNYYFLCECNYTLDMLSHSGIGFVKTSLISPLREQFL